MDSYIIIQMALLFLNKLYFMEVNMKMRIVGVLLLCLCITSLCGCKKVSGNKGENEILGTKNPDGYTNTDIMKSNNNDISNGYGNANTNVNDNTNGYDNANGYGNANTNVNDKSNGPVI